MASPIATEITKVSASQLLVNALKANGARYVLGIPGLHTLAIYDALFGETELEPIFVKHESGASYAAEGYAKAGGEPAVCLVVPGPGAINLAVGVASAYADSTPMVAITAQIPTNQIGTHAIHDCDIEQIYKSIVKAQLKPRTAAEIPQAIDEAFRLAKSGRPGPVQVILLTDLLDETAEIAPTSPANSNHNFILNQDTAFEAKIAQIAQTLKQASHPIIFAGRGVSNAGATDLLLEVATRLRAPVLTSFSGRGLLPETHPLSAGTITAEGAADLLAQADAGLVIGSCLSEYSTLAWRMQLPSRLVQIDVDPKELGNNYPLEVGLQSDAKAALTALLPLLDTTQSNDTLLKLNAAAKERSQADSREFMQTYQPHLPLHPGWVTRIMRQVCPPDTIFTSDGSSTEAWLHEEFFTITQPNSVIIPEVFQTMGYALPAAMGAKLARPDRPVVCVTGDGTLEMCLGELITAQRHQIPIVIVVYNDGFYNALRLRQERAYAGRYIGVDLGRVNFASLATNLGIKTLLLEKAEDFPQLMEAALRLAQTEVGPILLDLPIDPLPIPSRYTRSFKAGNH